jgi:myo-inositol 2-dehydrogenase/D-chiro-inositol 1-dehydrogenase
VLGSASHEIDVMPFPPDWRGRFADAYRRELQSWVNAISRWRSGTAESQAGPVDGPDAWDGYRAAVISQAVLASMSPNGPVQVKSISLPDLYQRCRARMAHAKVAV